MCFTDQCQHNGEEGDPVPKEPTSKPQLQKSDWLKGINEIRRRQQQQHLVGDTHLCWRRLNAFLPSQPNLHAQIPSWWKPIYKNSDRHQAPTPSGLHTCRLTYTQPQEQTWFWSPSLKQWVQQLGSKQEEEEPASHQMSSDLHTYTDK